METALDYFKNGKFVIVVDDETRENEGDLIIPASLITTDQMTFLLNHTTGIVCVAMEGARLDELKLPLMVAENTDLNKTAFTVSVDLLGDGVSTGVSASDRTKTVRALADGKRQASDFARPGHIFPLRAKPGGLATRRGHTEAAVELCQLAKVAPAGVLCELQKEDGTMFRLDDCAAFSKLHDIPLLTIDDILNYKYRETTNLLN